MEPFHKEEQRYKAVEVYYEITDAKWHNYTRDGVLTLKVARAAITGAPPLTLTLHVPVFD